MLLPAPLLKATLVKRYKRFLADAILDETGEAVTAHIANPGSMMGLAEPGMIIWLSRAQNPKRKLAYDWRLVSLEGGAIAGVSTQHPNRLVAEALADKRIPSLAAYATVQPEARYGAASRVDFLLKGEGLPDAYVEVKNVHLRRMGDLAEFPDSVTARGLKHLQELTAMVALGARAVMLYVVQRDDCARLAMAADLDPDYAAGLEKARAAGVEAIAHVCRFTAPDGPAPEIALDRALPIETKAASRPESMAGADGAEAGERHEDRSAAV